MTVKKWCVDVQYVCIAKNPEEAISIGEEKLAGYDPKIGAVAEVKS
jgi:hypothetical protein